MISVMMPTSGLLYNGNPVANKQIAFKINGSDVCAVTTLSNGTYYLTVKLKPVNNAATLYRIEAIFTGDEALNFTLYDTAPDGSQYALCTTLQYFGYKPSTAAATLTVEPQSTELLTANKTPEQIQTEAEQNGWLTIWHEFTWWPPWYRLHVKLQMGNATIHVAFNPVIPFFGGIVEFTGLETLLPPLPPTPQPPTPPPPPPNETSTILTEIVNKVLLSVVGLAVTAVATAYVPALPVTIAAIIGYSAAAGFLMYQAIQTFYSTEWGAHTKALAKLVSLLVGFAGAAIAVEMSFSAGAVFKSIVVPVLSTILTNLVNPTTLKAALDSLCFSMWTAMFASLAGLKIPNPSLTNVYFRPAFLIVNLVLFASTMASILALSAMASL